MNDSVNSFFDQEHYCDFPQAEIISFKKLINRAFDGLLVPIVRNFYRSVKAQEMYKTLKVGDKVLLVFDPANTFDENTIKVLSDPRKDEYGESHHFGFVDTRFTKYITEMTKQCFSKVYSNYIFNKHDVKFLFEVVERSLSIKIMFSDVKFL